MLGEVNSRINILIVTAYDPVIDESDLKNEGVSLSITIE